jgi:hypothetical protein
MNRVAVVFAAALGAACLTNCGLRMSTACAPPREADKARLIDFVQKKFRVPAGVPLEIAKTTPFGSSCFQKMVFRAKGGLSGFRMELVASPDFRFLTRDLMDSRVDPIQEELRNRQALQAGLAHAGLPSMGPDSAPVTVAIFPIFSAPTVRVWRIQ